MSIRATNSPSLPKPVAPYSHAAEAGGLIFVSGMLSWDRAAGEFVFDEVTAQVDRILTNLAVLLEDLGRGMGDVAKVTIFLTDLGGFASVNEVYARFFGSDPPARSCVQVAALPLGADIEIEAIVAAQ
jgi:2-iminobutanoate/2-iminopropanoate deaminase